MSQCLVCGQEMKWIEAGVSKTTGRPYAGFFACPAKCKQPQQAKPQYQTQPYNNTTTPQYQPKPYQAQKPYQAESDTTVFGKCKTLFLVEAFKMSMPLEEAEPLCERWAKASMRTIATNTFGQGKTWEQAKQELAAANLPVVEYEEVGPEIQNIPF